MRREASAIMRNQIFVPQIFYACRFYHAIKINQQPQPAPDAEDLSVLVSIQNVFFYTTLLEKT